MNHSILCRGWQRYLCRLSWENTNLFWQKSSCNCQQTVECWQKKSGVSSARLLNTLSIYLTQCQSMTQKILSHTQEMKSCPKFSLNFPIRFQRPLYSLNCAKQDRIAWKNMCRKTWKSLTHWHREYSWLFVPARTNQCMVSVWWWNQKAPLLFLTLSQPGLIPTIDLTLGVWCLL